MQLDDQSFLSLAKQNKERAFSYLVETYSGLVYSACLTTVRNKEDAEDVTQEVFTAAYLSLEKFEGKSKISTWLYSIALNKSKEFLRSKTRKKRFGIFTVLEKEDSHIVPEGTINRDHPGVQLENKERAAIFFEALDQLAENQKTAYTLHKVEGASYSEIAEIMETSVSSVESLMFRAKKRLKELLSDYYEKNER
jgi:RNA polymerase sigma-70 factor (ECF subfamily)